MLRLASSLSRMYKLILNVLMIAITHAAATAIAGVECCATAWSHGREGEGSTASWETTAKEHIHGVTTTLPPSTSHSTSTHGCSENVGEFRREATLRKHLSKYLLWINVMEWILASSLRSS